MPSPSCKVGLIDMIEKPVCSGVFGSDQQKDFFETSETACSRTFYFSLQKDHFNRT